LRKEQLELEIMNSKASCIKKLLELEVRIGRTDEAAIHRESARYPRMKKRKKRNKGKSFPPSPSVFET